MNPPPFLWFYKKGFLKRIKRGKYYLIPFEFLFQLLFWCLRFKNLIKHIPILLKIKNLRNLYPLFIFNSFTIYELFIFDKNGLKNRNQLSQYIPYRLSNTYHRFTREYWPNKCFPAIELLNNKEKLLKITPKRWKYPYKYSKNKKDEIFIINKDSAQDNIMYRLLLKDGLIVKPNLGFGGSEIYHLFFENNFLYLKNLFKKETLQKIAFNKKSNPNRKISHLLKDIFNEKTNLIFVPYLKPTIDFPESISSPVVRIITKNQLNTEEYSIEYAWLEVELEQNLIIFFNPQGEYLKFDSKLLTNQSSLAIIHWQRFLKQKGDSIFEPSKRSSVYMHKKLPPINKVAWDWIPSDPEPLLLEGNAEYDLLVPQLLDLN